MMNSNWVGHERDICMYEHHQLLAISKSNQSPLAHRCRGKGTPASLASVRNISNLSMAYD